MKSTKMRASLLAITVSMTSLPHNLVDKHVWSINLIHDAS